MMAKPIQDPTCGQSRQGEGGQGWAAPAVLVRGWEPHARARGAWSKGALHDEAARQSPTATSPAGHLPGPTEATVSPFPNVPSSNCRSSHGARHRPLLEASPPHGTPSPRRERRGGQTLTS